MRAEAEKKDRHRKHLVQEAVTILIITREALEFFIDQISVTKFIYVSLNDKIY